MRTVAGLVLFLLLTYGIVAHTSSPFVSPHLSTPSSFEFIAPAGKFAALHAELGLDLKAAARLVSDNGHAGNMKRSSGSGDDLTENLRDESWHQVGLDKMRRRSAKFGLSIDVNSPSIAHSRSDDRPSPNAHNAATSTSNTRAPSLHFAPDALRDPRTSAAHVLRAYAALAARESVSVPVSMKSGKAGRSKSSGSKKAGSGGSGGMGSGHMIRPGTTKRARGGRRLPKAAPVARHADP